MAQLNLNDCFPPGTDNSRKPLPKQGEFLARALSVGTPKYIAYVGGIGSGKSLIGCVTTLSWAVLYPGDYLIARQFMPELRATTYKTFLEICPPELILEHRVADAQIKIKATGGKTSWIMFRQLEEPEKLRSLNLSGFYVDEANQVTEEAFMLLQGRLRGPGVRKGILTTNPKGHDYIYRWFLKKDHIFNEKVKDQYHLIKAPSTENIHLPDDYLASMMASWSDERIQREIEGSFDAFEGMVYHEFRRDTHVIHPFKIPDNWDRHIRIDPGYRNPCSVGFYAVSPDGDVYRYKHIYAREWLVSEIINGDKKGNKTGLIDMIQRRERPSFKTCKIDPAAKQTKGATGVSEYDEYRRLWPEWLPMLYTANNDVKVGIDRCKQYLKVDPKTQKPRFFVFSTELPFLEEITTYQYEELSAGSVGKRSEDERPRKVNDHAMDEWRYMIVDLPEPFEKPNRAELERHKKYSRIEIQLQDEIKQLKAPKQDKYDPWQDS